VVPDEPVDYADTVGDTSIYRAEFDDQDNLVVFEKRLRTRQPGPEVAAWGEPGRKVFLRTQGAEFQPGPEIEYSATARLDSYLEGTVLESGDRASTTLVRQPIVIDDRYLYDRGTLVGRTVQSATGKVRRMAVVDGRLVATN
jgi:hypothetical protein